MAENSVIAKGFGKPTACVERLRVAVKELDRLSAGQTF